MDYPLQKCFKYVWIIRDLHLSSTRFRDYTFVSKSSMTTSAGASGKCPFRLRLSARDPGAVCGRDKPHEVIRLLGGVIHWNWDMWIYSINFLIQSTQFWFSVFITWTKVANLIHRGNSRGNDWWFRCFTINCGGWSPTAKMTIRLATEFVFMKFSIAEITGPDCKEICWMIEG